MKSILDPLRRHTGLSTTEATAVAGIALLLLAGWVGRSLTASHPTHDVESAQRVIELLDSLIANTQHNDPQATSYQPRDTSHVQRAKPRTTSHEQRATSFHRVNINTASARQLEALPGIGPATARKIIEERSQSPFQRVDDLVRVRGIGPAKLERMRPYVTAP